MKPFAIGSRLLGLVLVASLAAGSARAATAIKSICRIKGQEENSLQGLGIVVGLKGTGDGAGFHPTMRSLAHMMQLMGRPVSGDVYKELKDVKNVALVTVTATVPAAGARQGDKLDCIVSALAAKSLAGGRLLATALTGGRPDAKEQRVYAFAEGAISLDDPGMVTNGRVHMGCRMEEDFFNVFTQNDKICLVIDAGHADFEVAQDIVEVINGHMGYQGTGQVWAKAVNQNNVEVTIPPQYREDTVLFAAQVMSLQLNREPQTGARVVVNERAGSIVISGDVEIGAVVVTHKSVVVETGANANANAAGGPFHGLEAGGQPSPRLKSLVEALNALHVPPEDVIDIIKGLERNGKLHAQLIIE